MRKYTHNSPQAAARIVALTIFADGDVNNAEYDLLDRLAVHDRLGLDREALHEVLDTFCADLLSDNQLAWAGACPVDDYTLDGLMGEIDDPVLRRKVLDLCISIVEADEHIAEGESIVLVAAVEHWGLQRHVLRLANAVA